MTCSEFLNRFSDFHDGTAPPAKRAEFEAHLEGCASCRRYDRVVKGGVDLLRRVPPTRIRDDFRDRLRHSIYSADERARRRRSPDSLPGNGAMMFAAASVIFVAVLTVPFLLEEPPTVDLPVIVVNAPEAPPSERRALPRPVHDPFGDLNLWAQSNQLLFEHSQLFHRHRGPGLVRTGLQ